MKSIIFLALVAGLQIVLSEDWSYYGETGPEFWYKKYPECGGKSQTPINIEKDEAKCTKTSLRIKYLYRELEKITLKNDGHGFVFLFDFVNKNKPQVIQWFDEKQRLTEYVLHSAHIHWGPECDGGSEHTLNGHHFAAELHVVHYNRKYPDLDTAKTQPDGLAVLGVFFQLADQVTFEAKYENKFVKYLQNITNEDDTFVIPKDCNFKYFADLIKYDVKDFFSYKGSLTVPGCYESVRWLVSAEPIRIYPSELAEFNKLYLTNHRSLQPLNGRTVIKSC